MTQEDRYRHFSESFSLQGKVAIVTGASSGIGLEIAKLYARKGAGLVLFDRQKRDGLEEYILAQGGCCRWVLGDITKQQDIENLARYAECEFEKIDILVNCAGVGVVEPLDGATNATWDTIMAVNLTGAVRLGLKIGGLMCGTGGGSIINIASQAGVVALEQHLAYGTAKAGLIHATKQFALEWGPYQVRTNAISPTVILTPMGEEHWNNEKGEEFKKKIPLHRFGYPEEVAACAVFLASDAASLFNGANLVLDGGFTIA